jgi:hypothetical protein
MDEENVHIFAFQETRLRKLSNAHDDRFWLYRLAATARPPHLDVHSDVQRLQEDLVDIFWRSRAKKHKQPPSTMSADTWQLVCQKREKRNTFATYNAAQRRTLQAAWFSCWRHACLEAEHTELLSSFDGNLQQQDALIAVEYHCFRMLGRQVVKALRTDDVSFYDQLLQDCFAYLGPKDVKRLCFFFRRSLPRFQQRRMSTPPFQIGS